MRRFAVISPCKKLSKQRVYEQILLQIEESIVRGALTIGDQLPAERELAHQFGASRNAVRDAVKALHEKGLVETYPGRGTVVTDGTSHAIRLSLDRVGKIGQPQGFTYLAEVREILEPETAASAATATGEEVLATMREVVSAMDNARRDPDTFIEGDLDFHLALAEATANPLIFSLTESIVGLLRERRMRIFCVDGGPERGQYHHKRILEAIEHRDPVGAREAMKAHLRQELRDSQNSSSENHSKLTKPCSWSETRINGQPWIHRPRCHWRWNAEPAAWQGSQRYRIRPGGNTMKRKRPRPRKKSAKDREFEMLLRRAVRASNKAKPSADTAPEPRAESHNLDPQPMLRHHY